MKGAPTDHIWAPKSIKKINDNNEFKTKKNP